MYNPDNPFAKIIEGKLPAQKIFEDEYVIAFHDKNPEAQVHALVIPKKKCIDYGDFIGQSSPEEISHFFTKVDFVARALNLKSYKLVTNKGSESGQQVFHFHVHILGKKKI